MVIETSIVKDVEMQNVKGGKRQTQQSSDSSYTNYNAMATINGVR